MATTVNDAISRLVTLANNVAHITVFDGPAVTSAEDDNDDATQSSAWLAIGYQPGQADSVVIAYDWAQIGALRSEESYEVLCSLGVTTGDDDLPALRTRAVEIRDQFAAQLSADRTLGNKVRLAHIASSTLYQEPTARGLSVGFAFSIAVQARITT